MRFLKSVLSVSLLSLGLCTSVVVALQGSLVNAQSDFPEFVFARPQRSPDSEVPENRGKGASRPAASHCPKLDVFALRRTVENEAASGDAVETGGLTISESPVIWFAVDSLIAEATLELVVETAEGTVIDEHQKVLPAGDSVFSIPLTEGSLADKDVFYYFEASMAADCVQLSGDAPIAMSLASSGWIKRLPPEDFGAVERSLSAARAYAQSGIWFDAFDIVATLYRENPDEPEVKNAWDVMMKAAEAE